jgi:hypothetical protein
MGDKQYNYKAIGLEVDWRLKWSNLPDIIINMEEVPDVEKVPFKYIKINDHYWGTDGQLVHFYHWVAPDNNGGLGNTTVEIQMESGETVSLLGPWIGCSSPFGRYEGYEHVPLTIEVCVKSPGHFYSMFAQVDYVNSLIEQYLPDVELIRTQPVDVLVPCLKEANGDIDLSKKIIRERCGL